MNAATSLSLYLSNKTVTMTIYTESVTITIILAIFQVFNRESESEYAIRDFVLSYLISMLYRNNHTSIRVSPPESARGE